MKRYFVYLMFDGTPFHGWQVQPNANSVQEEIEQALQTLEQRKVEIVGAGRTDTGVHAEEMVFHFDTDQKWDKRTIIHRLNSLLPKTIAVFDLREVKADFHARFDATSRTYRYIICRKKNPFWLNKAYFFNRDLNVDEMNRAAALLLGEKDFTSFSKVHTQTFTNVCELRHAKWKEEGDFLIFEICANRFLRNMVRAVVGTLIEVGIGKRKAEDIPAILAAKNRSGAGASVPASGLYLSKIEYPEEGFIQDSQNHKTS